MKIYSYKNFENYLSSLPPLLSVNIRDALLDFFVVRDTAIELICLWLTSYTDLGSNPSCGTRFVESLHILDAKIRKNSFFLTK